LFIGNFNLYFFISMTFYSSGFEIHTMLKLLNAKSTLQTL